jgi:hypothetical protein
MGGSMKVYPVQLSPAGWFEGLSTSFSVHDLTEAPEMIRVQIDVKSQQLDTLNSQLLSLTLGSRGNTKALQEKCEKAQLDLDAAQSALSEQYTANVLSVAKTYLDAAGNIDIEGVSKKLGIATDIIKELPAQFTAVQKKQDALTRATRTLTQLQAAQRLAEATDTKQQQQQLAIQIQSVTNALSELQTRWKMLTAKSGGVSPTNLKRSTMDVPLDAQSPVPLPDEAVSGGGSRWQTITLKSTSETRAKLDTTAAQAKVRGFSILQNGP